MSVCLYADGAGATDGLGWCSCVNEKLLDCSRVDGKTLFEMDSAS